MSDKEKMFYRLLLQAFVDREFVTTKTMSEITGMAESTIRRHLFRFRDFAQWNGCQQNRQGQIYGKVLSWGLLPPTS